MHTQIKGKVTVNAPAEKVWQIVAHDFEHIGQWASAIPTSFVNTNAPAVDGAAVGGRVCTNSVAGFDDIHETFTYYDEAAMKFGYAATDGLPGFMEAAENNWSVKPVNANKCTVEARGEVDVKAFPGLFMFPFLKWQMGRIGKQTMEELKYFAEHGQPHPRKAKQAQNAKSSALNDFHIDIC